LKDLDEKWLDGKLMGIFSSTKNQIRQSLSQLIRFKEILGFLIPISRQKSFLRKPCVVGSPVNTGKTSAINLDQRSAGNFPMGLPDGEKVFEIQRECLILAGTG
jgi:hypothetical protein